MVILHFAETIKGGVATVLRQLMVAQNRDDIKSYCCVPGDQADELGPIEPDRIMKFRRTGRNARSLFHLAQKIVTLTLKIRPDIIHFHSTFAGAVGRILLFFLRPICSPRIVYTPHGWAFIMNSPNAVKYFYSRVEKILLLLTDIVICVSHYEKQSAKTFGLSVKKIVVIHNGVEQPLKKREKSPYSHKPINILYVGRFDKAKGFDILYKAMQYLEHKNYHLTAVGAAVQSGPLSFSRKNITFTGWLKTNQISRYFKYADFLVMPSRWEAFGLVAVEANSYGLPVIASHSASLPEVVKNGITGYLFDPDSETDLVDIILRTKLNTWRELGKRSNEYYLKNFTSKKMCETTEIIYLSITTGEKY